ncbi:MAG TPA: ATP-dependent DNA ligase, partial [Nocardioides sp.]|nr:ATP-dependent DNA ligase [Nocardioides sp.]
MAASPIASLPVPPPVLPMLAKSVAAIPRPPAGGDGPSEGFSYESKWDGFRCIAFRSGDDVELGSRNTKPLTRYFPEVVEAVRAALPERCVVDGELVVPRPDARDGVDGTAGGTGRVRLDFDRLQDRIHPAASRVALLSESTPASLVVFDLLALDDEELTGRPLAERRARLEEVLGAGRAGSVPGASSAADLTTASGVYLSQTTRDPDEAQRWFEVFEGAGLDGVVAKRLDGAYQADKRGWLKIKHERTADVVVAGYRLHKTSTPERPLLGSLLLGLYAGSDDAAGDADTADTADTVAPVLHHVGVAASFTMARRAELVAELRPLEIPLTQHPWARWQTDAESGDSRLPGGVSRWNA